MTTILKLFSIFRISKVNLLLFFMLLYIGFEKGILDQDDITIIFQMVADFCKFIYNQVTTHVTLFNF